MMLSKNDLLAAAAKPLAQSRNIFWDTFFYDVHALSPAEIGDICRFSDHEGAIVVVSPTAARKPIRSYANATAMLATERSDIGGISIAGVGSSIVGTAALARNVADAYGIDIAGIVSGYGATDLLAEAMGGWFLYGYIDKFRHYLEIMVEKSADCVAGDLAPAPRGGRDFRQDAIPRQLDSGALYDILMADPGNLKILVGHSKGAMLIDFVLEEFVRRCRGGAHRYYDELHVVTVGVVVALPKKFRRTSQIIGTLDWFGGMNSLPDLLRDVDSDTRPKFIDNAWHHLNTEIPYRLGLIDALGTHVRLH